MSDYTNWIRCGYTSPFHGGFYYRLGNGKKVTAYVYRVATEDVDGMYEVVVRYFWESFYSDTPIEVTKDQLERYIMEHRNEV